MTPPAARLVTDLLKQIVMSWDSDDSLEFLEGMTLARQFLGMKLTDIKEELEDLEVLRANKMRTTLTEMKE